MASGLFEAQKKIREKRNAAENTDKILTILKRGYPDARIALNFSNTLELLIATILSAQCTDERVNIVTGTLFKKYRRVEDYARADKKIFESEIRSTGFFHNKTKNIILASKIIKAEFDGKVPDSMEQLLRLPGVARKTANIVLFNGFAKVEGVAVDTHVRRVSKRLVLTAHDNPDKIEKDLMELLDRKDWGKFSYLMIEHGRRICTAKKPECPECILKPFCPSGKLFLMNRKE